MVGSGAAALEAARAEKPELVISDIRMPGMSGYDLVQRLKTMVGFDDVVFVALTGSGQPEKDW